MQEIIDTKSIEDNVIEKLNVYMNRNGQTMHGMASDLGFDYQPFYRLMTKKSTPTINSLNQIAKKLNCKLVELLADDIFLDVPYYENIDLFLSNESTNKMRVFLPHTLLQSKIKEKFIAIKTNLTEEKMEHRLNNITYAINKNIYQLFNISKQFDLDGFFLVRYKNKIIILEVISVSSTLITAKYKGKTTQIPVSELEIFLKFIGYVELPNQAQITFKGAML